MLQYDKFSNLTTEELHEKISKMRNMIGYYRFMNNLTLVKNLEDMIETCYYVIDEKNYTSFIEEYSAPDGVVIDTGEEHKQDEQKPRKRKRNTGRIV
jgi:hypothetical protein